MGYFKSKTVSLCLGVLIVLSLSTMGLASTDVYTGNPVASIFEKTSPAVVNIDTEAMVKQNVSPFGNDPVFREFFGDRFREFSRMVPMRGKGSGFIVSKDGKILTNNHVVADADKITVSLSDGRSFEAKVVGKDPTFDLAVLKIEATGLPVLNLGDSDKTRVGEWAIAIGNPLGLEHTVTVGVVSAKNRSIHVKNFNFEGFIQTDAAINPGNSGGPLLDLEGKVIGINTAIIPYAQGIGFAIPVNMAKQVMDDIDKYGKVRRGWLGVYIQSVTRDFADAYKLKDTEGAVISDVVAGSPAAEAGLNRGDVIKSIDGTSIKDHQDFVFKVRRRMAGEKVKLDVIRRGKKVEVSVTLGEVDSSSGMETDPSGAEIEKLGLKISRVTPKFKKKYDLSSEEGVLILSVTENSAGALAGLREGDVILEASGMILNKPSDLALAIKKSPKSVVLLVSRDGRTSFISLSVK